MLAVVQRWTFAGGFVLKVLVCVALVVLAGCCCGNRTRPTPPSEGGSPTARGARPVTASLAGSPILSSASGRRAVVITDATDGAALAAALGEWVRVEGEVSNTKVPQIAGVDVAMPTEPITGSRWEQVVELRGTPAWAEGILERRVVRPEQVDHTIASRGAGTFYRLVDPGTGKTAVAYPAGSDR